MKDNTFVRILSAMGIFGVIAGLYFLGSAAIQSFVVLLTGFMMYEIWHIKVVKRGSFVLKSFFSVYVIGSIACFLYLFDIKGEFFILWMILLVSTNDTAAFFAGRFLKGKKLIPSVSPNKTWSGLIGGVLVGTTVSYFTQSLFMEKMFSPVLCCLISVSSHLGDLIESAFKRYLDVKDMSMIIPGHGGILDRLDSILFVSFIIFLVINLWL